MAQDYCVVYCDLNYDFSSGRCLVLSCYWLFLIQFYTHRYTSFWLPAATEKQLHVPKRSSRYWMRQPRSTRLEIVRPCSSCAKPICHLHVRYFFHNADWSSNKERLNSFQLYTFYFLNVVNLFELYFILCSCALIWSCPLNLKASKLMTMLTFSSFSIPSLYFSLSHTQHTTALIKCATG